MNNFVQYIMLIFLMTLHFILNNASIHNNQEELKQIKMTLQNYHFIQAEHESN